MDLGVLFYFCGFSGYGMGHMLASMSNVSTGVAIIAGLIWALFQWCLERQILISIRADATFFAKLIGISWRGALALLSATTMVYPFLLKVIARKLTSNLARLRARV